MHASSDSSSLYIVRGAYVDDIQADIWQIWEVKKYTRILLTNGGSGTLNNQNFVGLPLWMHPYVFVIEQGAEREEVASRFLSSFE